MIDGHKCRHFRQVNLTFSNQFFGGHDIKMVILKCATASSNLSPGFAKKNIKKFNLLVQLGPRYEGQLNPMAEPIPHEVRPLVRTHGYHPYHAADRQAETDS